MPSRSRRSYDQFCAIARALDSVGDRWTLLIVRELLAGPRRYTDLHADLPGVSTDVLASRLKHMEGEGIAERRRQLRPGSGFVYELTPRGRELLPVLGALAAWGAPALGKPRPTDAVRAHWWALPVRTALETALGVALEGAGGDPGSRAAPESAPAPPPVRGGVVDVRLPEGAFHVRVHLGPGPDPDPAHGRDPAHGSAPGEAPSSDAGASCGQEPFYGEGPAPQRADAGLELDADVCARIADGSATLADEIRAGSVRVTGAGPLAQALRPA